MLLPRQWTRVAGGVLAGSATLLLLKTFLLPGPYRNIVHLSSYSSLLSSSGPSLDQQHEDAKNATAIPHEHQAVSQGTETWPGRISSSIRLSPASTTNTAFEPENTPASHVQDSPGGVEEPFVAAGSPSQGPVTYATDFAGGTSDATAAPEPTEIHKTIVMGKLSWQDTDWVQDIMQDWDHAVYYVDLADHQPSPSGLKTKMNKAKEATPYLTYIVEHYDNLPDIAVFLHAHRNGWPEAWHNDAKGYDAVNMLQELKLDVVLDRGYVNLRCLATPGCPNEVQLNRNPPEDERSAELAYPYVYGQLFNLTAAEVKEQIPVVATPCCAQFAVSRAQILQRPKAEYARYLTLIEESEYDDDTLGTVMEYTWHIIFGRDAVHCENTVDCWANIYGRQAGWSVWT